MRTGIRLVLMCASVASVLAQDPYGRITGRVMDSAGALIPAAAVKATNTQTNVVTTTVADSQGNYDLRHLISGTYRISVEMQGFKRHERGPLEVRVGDVLNVEVALELGVLSESVTITAQAPLLESASASLGQVVDNRRLLDLPLPGASPMYLTQLAPGVISQTAPTHGWLPQTRQNLSNFAADGAGGNSSEFTLDGIPNMTKGGKINLVPPPEMLQEFRVQTAAFDASVGHFTGAQVNMVTRSGTNALHGNLTFSHYSRPLMTHPFFVNKVLYDTASGPITPQKINSAFPPTKLNRYRASAGGPVLIPKLYDGRNRTFWTYGQDRFTRVFLPAVSALTVPAASQRGGDFSALLALGPQYQIYDPATIAPAPAGRFSRQPLPGNRIPANRIDPMARRLLEYFPAPNTAGTADGLNNYSGSPRQNTQFQSHTMRVDHAVNANNRLFVSFLMSRENTGQQLGFPSDFLGLTTLERDYNFAFDDVLTPRPDLVVDLRYGVTRSRQDNQPGSLGFDLTAAGFPASLASRMDRSTTTLPQLNIDGYQTIPRDYSGLGTLNATTYHTFAGSVSHNRGSHSLRMGGESRLLRETNNPYATGTPSFNFSAAWTRGPLDNSPAAPIGQGLASFLFGLPGGGSIERNASYAEQSGLLGLYWQDDWKISRKLTLNLGLRYELELPTTERYNRTNRGFDPRIANPIEAAARANYARTPIPEVPVSEFRAAGGLLFAGLNGIPRGLWNTDRDNFAPRFGLAYLCGPKTVVRVGYGVFFESLGADRISVFQQGYSQSTSITPSLDNGLTFRATLANPFPDGVLDPAGAAAGLTTFLGRAPGFFYPDRRTGYMQRWSFNLQRELPHRVLVEAGYVGNTGSDLGVSEDLNPVPAKYLSTSPVRDQAAIDYLSQAATNPFASLPEFAGSNLQGRTVQRSQLLRPFPQFSGVSTTLAGGYSWYHSLQMRAEKRFSHGYTLQASYTWSKNMQATGKLNGTDTAPQYAISGLDRPQHLVVSGIYEIPVGKGKRWLARGWQSQVAGGWSVQAIYQAQSGPPIGFGNIIFGGRLKDMVLPRGQRTVERWFNVDAGFERDSRKQLGSNIRTFPARLTGLRADGFNSWDLSVFKGFRIAEKATFQLRAEAQDALNHAMFASPNTTPTSTLFGQVANTIFSEQRKITVGGRLTW